MVSGSIVDSANKTEAGSGEMFAVEVEGISPSRVVAIALNSKEWKRFEKAYEGRLVRGQTLIIREGRFPALVCLRNGTLVD